MDYTENSDVLNDSVGETFSCLSKSILLFFIVIEFKLCVWPPSQRLPFPDSFAVVSEMRLSFHQEMSGSDKGNVYFIG